MTEFRSSTEEQAFEDFIKQPDVAPGASILDRMKLSWFAARGFFDKNSVAAASVPQVHIFELTGDTEIPVFVSWAEKLNPGVPFDIPPAGTVVIARNSRFDFFIPAWRAAGQDAEVKAASQDARETQHIRLQILQVVGDVERARAVEKWVLGESGS